MILPWYAGALRVTLLWFISYHPKHKKRHSLVPEVFVMFLPHTLSLKAPLSQPL